MFDKIGYTNARVIYHHSTVITKVMLLYNTEWRYDHEIAVNYRGKKFYNIDTWTVLEDSTLMTGGNALNLAKVDGDNRRSTTLSVFIGRRWSDVRRCFDVAVVRSDGKSDPAPVDASALTGEIPGLAFDDCGLTETCLTGDVVKLTTRANVIRLFTAVIYEFS